jgi:hypothetical protein
MAISTGDQSLHGGFGEPSGELVIFLGDSPLNTGISWDMSWEMSQKLERKWWQNQLQMGDLSIKTLGKW